MAQLRKHCPSPPPPPPPHPLSTPLGVPPAAPSPLSSVEAVWCNRTLEFTRNISRVPRNANQGAGGSMRAIPVVNPGSMRALAAAGAAAGPSGSMRTLFAAAGAPSALPAPTGAGVGGGPATTTSSDGAAAGGPPKPKFGRKQIGVGGAGPEIDPEDVQVCNVRAGCVWEGWWGGGLEHITCMRAESAVMSDVVSPFGGPPSVFPCLCACH
jgi:hypothetical protein